MILELCKALFIMLMTLALEQTSPAIKSLKEDIALANGDTTQVQRQNIEWEEKYYEDLQRHRSVVKSYKELHRAIKRRNQNLDTMGVALEGLTREMYEMEGRYYEK